MNQYTKREERRRRKKRQRRRQVFVRRAILLVGCVLLISIGISVVHKYFVTDVYMENEQNQIQIKQPEMDVDLLTMNPYSRPGTKTDRIQNIVIHYTANPGTSAKQNRNYFEGLKDSHETKASSHFIIGIEGEIVQCVPTWEVAYASNDRNQDTVSIENCHLEESGEFTKETYKSLVHLTAWLCQKFDLTEKDLLRHYDISGKLCPKYYVEHETAWEEFKTDVKKMLEETDE